MKPTFRSTRGLTLVEVMIAMTIAGILSGAMMNTLLFIARSEHSIQSYFDMNSGARKALEVFGRDVRMARKVVLGTNNTVTLTVPIKADPTLSDGYKDYTVTYSYFDASATTASLRNTFCRRVSASEDTTAVAAPNTESRLLDGVVNFAFKRYQLSSPIRAPLASAPETSLPEANNDMETKQLLVSLTTQRTHVSVARATDLLVSARYILRNKVVTN